MYKSKDTKAAEERRKKSSEEWEHINAVKKLNEIEAAEYAHKFFEFRNVDSDSLKRLYNYIWSNKKSKIRNTITGRILCDLSGETIVFFNFTSAMIYIKKHNLNPKVFKAVLHED